MGEFDRGRVLATWDEVACLNYYLFIFSGVSPPDDEVLFFREKDPKTISAVASPFGCAARFTDPGGGQTRFAQTVPAFSPVPVALLGHATRPGEPWVSGRTILCVGQGPPADLSTGTVGRSEGG